MLAALGIILLIGGAILAFAVDRQSDGVDLVALGWIVMAGGGLALLAAAIQAAGWYSLGNRRMPARRGRFRRRGT